MISDRLFETPPRGGQRKPLSQGKPPALITQSAAAEESPTPSEEDTRVIIEGEIVREIRLLEVVKRSEESLNVKHKTKQQMKFGGGSYCNGIGSHGHITVGSAVCILLYNLVLPFLLWLWSSLYQRKSDCDCAEIVDGESNFELGTWEEYNEYIRNL